jgi:hypothetical protein
MRVMILSLPVSPLGSHPKNEVRQTGLSPDHRTSASENPSRTILARHRDSGGAARRARQKTASYAAFFNVGRSMSVRAR